MWLEPKSGTRTASECATNVFTTQLHAVLDKTKKIFFSLLSPRVCT